MILVGHQMKSLEFSPNRARQAGERCRDADCYVDLSPDQWRIAWFPDGIESLAGAVTNKLPFRVHGCAAIRCRRHIVRHQLR